MLKAKIMALSSKKKESLSEVIGQWDQIDESPLSPQPFDWRVAALKRAKEKDLSGMIIDAAPLAEMKVMDLMQYSGDEKIQLDAAKFVLGQSGHGVVQQVTHNVSYEKMESDQLVVILRSKLHEIKKLNPGLNLSNLLDTVIDVESVDGEVIESDQSVDMLAGIDEVGPEGGEGSGD